MSGRDESEWMTFDIHATLSLAPEVAERLRLHLFTQLRHIEADDPEVLAIEHDLPSLCQRALDRHMDPLAETYEVSGEDLWDDYWFLGAPGFGKVAEPPARDDRTVWRITAADLDALVGRELTDDELAQFEEYFGNTSVGECVDGCLGSIIPVVEDEDEDDGYAEAFGPISLAELQDGWATNQDKEGH